MKIYEIDEALEKCFDMETGEMIDEAAFNALLEEKNAKIEGVACIIKNRAALIAELKAEKARITERIAALENRNAGTMKFLDDVLGGRPFETAKVRCAYRKSTTVDVIDITKIPEKYVDVVTDLKPDKKAIKEAIKGGQDVPGVVLCDHENLSVK